MQRVVLNKLSLQFLSGLALNEFSFQNVNWDLKNQEILLNSTVNSDLVLEYPLKTDYQRLFLKFWLKILEKEGREIHDDLYSAYGRLVALPDSKSEYYKHYPIDTKDTVISLKESIHLISEGTTGLRTWQASLALAEWCLTNENSLFNKNILELGSGIGLTGLVASLKCQPSKIYFSDCHPSVLKTLCENIDFNCKNIVIDKNCSINKLSDKVLLERKLHNGTKVLVLNLPWEKIDHDICEKLGKIDIILAADVVYDVSLFHPLIKALRCISEQGEVDDIVFACTERNPETLDSFIEEVGQHFKIIREDCPSQEKFVWPSDPPVRIFRFTLF